MRLFQSNYSLPELTGLSHEEKKRIIKASQTATWKNRKVWLSLILMFLASGMTNILPKLIIFSSWYWRIESELVRRVIIEIAPWPLNVFALVYFCHAYGQTFHAALRDQRIVILHAFIKKTQTTPEQDLYFIPGSGLKDCKMVDKA